MNHNDATTLFDRARSVLLVESNPAIDMERVQWTRSPYEMIFSTEGSSLLDNTYGYIGGKIPLSPTLIQRILDGDSIRFSGYHVTSPSMLGQLFRLQKTSKSISASSLLRYVHSVSMNTATNAASIFLSRKKIASNLKKYDDSETLDTNNLLRGVWHDGCVVKFNGNLLASRGKDIMSTPDENGRRWLSVNTFFMYLPNEDTKIPILDTQEEIAKRFCDEYVEKVMDDLDSLTQKHFGKNYNSKVTDPNQGIIGTFFPDYVFIDRNDYHNVDMFCQCIVFQNDYIRPKKTKRTSYNQWLVTTEPYINTDKFAQRLLSKFSTMKLHSDTPEEIHENIKKLHAYCAEFLSSKRKAYKKLMIQGYYDICTDVVLKILNSQKNTRKAKLETILNVEDSVNMLIGSGDYDEAVVNQIEIEGILTDEAGWDNVPPDDAVFIQKECSAKNIPLIILPDDSGNKVRFKPATFSRDKIIFPKQDTADRQIIRSALKLLKNPTPYERITNKQHQ